MNVDQGELPEAVRLSQRLQSLLDEYLGGAHGRAIAPRSMTGMPSDRETARAVLHLVGAMNYRFPTGGVPQLSATDGGRALLDLTPADRARLAAYTYVAFSLSAAYTSPLERVFSDLFRAKLELGEEAILELLQASKRLARTHRYERISSILGVLRRHAERELEPAVRQAIADLCEVMKTEHNDAHEPGRKVIAALDALLEPAMQSPDESFRPKPDTWGEAVTKKLAGLTPGERAAVVPILRLASEGGEAAKPTKTWLAQTRRALEHTDREVAGAILLDLIACHDPTQTVGWTGRSTLSLENQNTLRAMLWLAGLAASRTATRRLEGFARTYLTWVGFDYYSLILGNAAIFAFTLMPGTEGVAGLSRLRHHLKRPGEIKTIDKALATLAATIELSPGELEELALPDYGFDAAGRLVTEVGPATVTLTLTPSSALTATWDLAGYEPSSAPPPALKETSADELAEFKAKTKEIEETLKAQRLRFERFYLSERSWPLTQWRERYLHNPLVAHLTRRLIWSFENAGQWSTGLPESDSIAAVDGSTLSLPAAEKRVRLWHPMQSEASEVLAWRRRLAELLITQPFKQAHREVYVLTDDEREATQSNRFAGHIVDQNVFRAVAQGRGWKSPLLGMWHTKRDYPTKDLADHGLRVEFAVNPVEGEGGEPKRGSIEYLSTDVARFVKVLGRAVPGSIAFRDGSTLAFKGPASAPVALAEVGPVLFSEMMRDIDLFVGSSSIATDPTWNPGRRGFATYWNHASFGSLGETGKARRAALIDLLPSLSIASRCRLDERYLIVQGNLTTYRIHLGSSNVQMDPNDQHLSIPAEKVPPLEPRVQLPFEDDSLLTLIVSKAFMLAADDKLRDRAIRAQIQSL